MKTKTILMLLILTFTFTSPIFARSAINHIIKSGNNITKAIGSPFYGLLYKGPKNIKETWQYEVHEREKEEDRGKLKYKLFSIWRAPGDELKGTIDGLTDMVKYSGDALKEILSIPFSD